MLGITRRIPKWAIGSVGAVLAIISTLYTTIILQGYDENIASQASELTSIRQSIDTLWNNHILGEQRLSMANLALGLFLLHKNDSDSNANTLLLGEISGGISGALIATMGAAEQPIPRDAPYDSNALINQMAKGDYALYNQIRADIIDLKRKSEEVISDKFLKMKDIEAKILNFQSKSRIATYLGFSITIIGLIITLLKDLPIWKQADFNGDAP